MRRARPKLHRPALCVPFAHTQRTRLCATAPSHSAAAGCTVVGGTGRPCTQDLKNAYTIDLHTISNEPTGERRRRWRRCLAVRGPAAAAAQGAAAAAPGRIVVRHDGSMARPPDGSSARPTVDQSRRVDGPVRRSVGPSLLGGQRVRGHGITPVTNPNRREAERRQRRQRRRQQGASI